MRFLDNFVRLYRLLPDGSLWGLLALHAGEKLRIKN